MGLVTSELAGTNVPDSVASLLIGILLAATAFGLARPLADFLIGRSLAQDQLEKLYGMVEDDPSIHEIIQLRALYTGPEEVVVLAKIHPAGHLSTEELAKAMDDLDGAIRTAFPLVADVFIDVTTHRVEAADPA